MTSKFIEYMEQKSYLIAEKLSCLGDNATMKKNYPEKRIAMNQLFDGFAGSETGAIIATMMVIPKNSTDKRVRTGNNRYFATDITKFFEA